MEWNILYPDEFKTISDKKNVGTLLAKVLNFRDENIDQQVSLHSFTLFHDYQKILTRIEQAISNKEKVVIYGDYDCDGICATSILVRAFELRGLNVGYHIPNRFVDGYGLNVARVEEMAKKDYTLIITVDNGVSAFDAVKRANELNMDVIITDHHDLPEVLPEAYAILHTQLSPDYPFKAISGGFVACKLAMAMLNQMDPYIYCLAALSTISDMMPMVDENRTLVKQCLEWMNNNHYLSLDLLLGENQVFTSQSLGFNIAPKINSIGRLDEGVNPNKCVTYLRHSGANSQQEREFKVAFSEAVTKMNQARQRLTTSQYEKAIESMNDVSGAIVAKSINFHEGLVGLVAGRMTNQYYRPSFIMKEDQSTGILKGSARSIDGIDMYECLTYAKDSLLVFGGHQKAGGFSLESCKYQQFLGLLNEFFKDHLTAELLVEKKQAIHIEASDIYIPFVRELSRLEPFGQMNEEPVFHLHFDKIDRIETISNGKHLKLFFDLPNCNLQVLYFSQGKLAEDLNTTEPIDLFGTLSINKFRNMENIQMILKDLR